MLQSRIIFGRRTAERSKFWSTVYGANKILETVGRCKWFKSKKELKKYVSKVMQEYNRQYEDGEITWEEYKGIQDTNPASLELHISRPFCRFLFCHTTVWLHQKNTKMNANYVIQGARSFALFIFCKDKAKR